MSVSLGVVVPVFNEEAGVERGLREITSTVTKWAGGATVIAVDDGSSDGSPAILDRLEAELEHLLVVRHAANAGYGQALRTGAKKALELGLDYVAFMDSDLTNPPEDVLRMAALANDGHEYIKASRFVSGGSMAEVPWSRRVFSEAGNRVGGVLFGAGVRDVTNGFRCGRTELMASIETHERGFASIVEELDQVLARGVSVTELPTVLTARGGDQRATAFAYSGRQVLSYLKYPMRSLKRRVRER